MLSLSVASEDCSLAAMHGLLIAAASFVAKHRFWGDLASVVGARAQYWQFLSSGAQAQ